MTAIVTPTEITAHLESMTAVELRKLGATMGIKGASKGKKADLVAAIAEVRIAEAQEAAKAAAALAAATAPVHNATAGDDSEAAKKARRSRRGMVIVAKGTEVHKSQTFKAAAEAAGFQVEIDVTARMMEDEDGEFYEVDEYTATATRSGYILTASWVGRAWNYAGAGAGVGGHARKVRNLKEALRILAGQA